MSETVRYELKFYISPLNAEILKKKLQYLMPYDLNGVNGAYNVKSLYFDDFYDTSLREKMEGNNKAPKFRIRIYNHDISQKRLERKHKKGDIVSKKSLAISNVEYDQFIKCSNSFSHEFQELYTGVLKPKVIIAYDRTAFVYEPGHVRITFDSHIKASTNHRPCLNKSTPYRNLPTPENIIFEVKYTDFFPVHLRGIFQEASTKQSISKYAAGRLPGLL